MKIFKKGIWASGIERGIRQRQDVTVRANRKALGLAEFRILEFLTQLLQEVCSALLIVASMSCQGIPPDPAPQQPMRQKTESVH